MMQKYLSEYITQILLSSFLESWNITIKYTAMIANNFSMSVGNARLDRIKEEIELRIKLICKNA